MPSRSRPSSPSRYEKEKPYDQGSEQSSDEDFVNATTAPRPSSRASAASGGSRSSRREKPAVVSESSSESTESEEERELQSELQDAAGTETGVVRGAPVESKTARIMRSVGKGSSSSRSAQQYASLANEGDLEQGRSGSSGRKHKHKHRKSSNRQYSVADASRKMPAAAPVPGGSNFSDHRASTVQGKTKSKRTCFWVSISLIALVVVAAIIAGVVFFVKRKSGDTGDDLDSASNSTSLSDHANSTSSANSTLAGHHTANSTGLEHGSATQTHLPVDGSSSETASPVIANTASYDDGKYRPSTAATAQSTASASLEDAASELEEGQQGISTSVATKNGVSGASTALPVQSQASTASQVYGDTASSGLVAGAASPSTGSVAQGGVASIQTVPKPQPSSGPNQVGQQAESNASNAGQWNALSSEGAAQPTQVQGGTQAQPTQAQGGDSAASGSSLHFGVGPVVPSSTGGLEGAAPASTAAVWGDSNNNGQPSTTQASTWTGEQAQPPSPVDSTAAGAFTAGEFRQATHPESFQTYVDAPATWFKSSGHYGACGLATNNTDYVVAINNAIWLNSTKGSATSQSPYCGAEVLITSMTDGATVNAWVTERCAYCSAENAGSIDLSKAVFQALAGGSTDAGSLNVVWGFTGNSSAGTTTTQGSSSTSTLGGSDGTAKSTDSADDSAEATSTSSDGGWFWRRQTMI